MHVRTSDTAGSFADPHSKVNTEKKLDEFFVGLEPLELLHCLLA